MRILSLLVILLFFFLTGCDQPKVIEGSQKIEPKNDPPKAQSTTIDPKVQEFWQLVAKQQAKEAIALANDLVKDNSGKKSDFIAQLFAKEDVKESVFMRKEFNEIDFFFWSQAQFFFSILNDLKGKTSKENIIENIYKLVGETVLPEGQGEDIGVYPISIWERKFGACDRETWVFCEITRQLGAEVSIIYLYDETLKTYPHTIGEIVYEGEHYVVDVLYQKILPKTKFTDLTPEKIKEVWQDKPFVHNTFAKAVRLIPSMPIDYSERNQRLTARLQKVITFAEPPQNSYHFWKQIYPNQEIKFWDYSIRLLKTMKLYQDVEK